MSAIRFPGGYTLHADQLYSSYSSLDSLFSTRIRTGVTYRITGLTVTPDQAAALMSRGAFVTQNGYRMRVSYCFLSESEFEAIRLGASPLAVLLPTLTVRELTADELISGKEGD